MQARRCSFSLPEQLRSSSYAAPAYVATLGLFGLVFAAVAHSYVVRFNMGAAASFSIYAAFVLLLALVLAPGFRRSDLCVGKTGLWPLMIAALCCAPYLIYALGTGDFRALALLKLSVLAAFTVALYAVIPVARPAVLNWQDIAVASAFVAAVLTGQLKSVWNIPVNLDFMSRLFLIALAAWTWTTVRPVAGLGYSFRFSTEICVQAARKFGWFSLIALPVSLGLHFTKWNPHWRGLASFALDFLEIFLFVALLEELFFRGFLQNLLGNTLRNATLAQIIVAVLFGLFHILHAPFPNWRYVTLASLAGWFYGSAFRKTGSLMASTLTHAAVDTVWRTWLSAR